MTTDNNAVSPKNLLTVREEEVLKCLIKAQSNGEIAKEFSISVNTAKAHVHSIIKKLCVKDRVQSAVKAIREHLI